MLWCWPILVSSVMWNLTCHWIITYIIWAEVTADVQPRFLWSEDKTKSLELFICSRSEQHIELKLLQFAFRINYSSNVRDLKITPWIKALLKTDEVQKLPHFVKLGSSFLYSRSLSLNPACRRGIMHVLLLDNSHEFIYLYWSSLPCRQFYT